MKWTEIRIHTTNEAQEAICNLLHESGANGVVIEDPLDLIKERENSFGEIYALNSHEYPREGIYIKAYVSAGQQLTKWIDELKASINQLKEYDIDLGPNAIAFTEVDDEDWATAWKKYYKPLKISNHITIVPTWEQYDRADDEIIIELDPGMAFGTGTHPTTILSIRALEQYVKNDDLIVDVGCGSGILSIASVLLGARHAYAYDLDDVAVASTMQNAAINRIDDRIEAKQNNLLDQVNVQADIVVSNILAEIIVQFVPDAWKNLRTGGYFITSGIIQEKKQLVLDELEKHQFLIVDMNEMDGWVAIIAKK